MKKWNVYALMTIFAMSVGLSGCQMAKRVPEVSALLKLENEEATKKLEPFTRDDITDAWGDPDYEMQFGNGDLYIRGDNEECLCVYYEADGNTVKYARVNLHGGIQEFTGVITEDYENSAVVTIDDGYAISQAGTQVTVDLGEENQWLDVDIGNRVHVTYIGPVMETMPLQLMDQIRITVVEQTDAPEISGNGTSENAENPAFEDVDHDLEGIELDGVTLSIDDVTPTSATVKILNETDMEIMYGEDYNLQVFEEADWHDVPYLIDNWAFIAIGYGAPKHTQVEWEVNWETFHGVLEPGTYRLAKSVTDFRGTGDFTNYLYYLEFEITE